MDDMLPSRRSDPPGPDIDLEHTEAAAPPWLVTALRLVAAQPASSNPTVETIALAAAQHLVNTIPAVDHAVVWLHDASRQQLQPVVDDASSAAAIRDPRMALHVGEGAVGSAFTSRQIHMRSFDSEARMRSVPQVSEHAVQPVAICLPLVAGTTPVGVLELLNDDGTWADATDLSALQAVADQLALVIGNAALSDRLAMQQQRLAAYEAVVGIVGDPQDVLERMADVVLATAGSRSGLLLSVEQAGLCVVANRGFADRAFAAGAMLDVAPALDDALQTRDRRIVPLPQEQTWQAMRDAGIDRLALLPLTAGASDVHLLVIGLRSGDEAYFDWPTLEALSRQIGTVIATNRLYTASQRERRRLRSVIGAIAEGVIICDRDGRLVLANDAARAMAGNPLRLGTSADDLGTLLAIQDSDGRVLPLVQMPLARSLRGETYQNLDLRITDSQGIDRIITCSGAPLLADDGTIDGAVVVFRDVTAFKAHDALRDEFVAVAAHEMRAPLAAIKGYADLLLRREMQRPDTTDRDRRGVLMLSRQVDHLVRLVDNLLDVSRLDAGRLELYLQPADLIALLEASIDRISMGDANHEFYFNGPASLPIVCDQLRLQQVFTNILSNAARYSPTGTSIWVDVWTEPCTIEDGVVTQRDGSDQCVTVAVRDQGVGMTPDVQAKVFDRYYRANTATAASGLGLGVYLSREIVQRHGGTIWLDSTAGAGTTFYVRLPLQASEPV